MITIIKRSWIKVQMTMVIVLLQIYPYNFTCINDITFSGAVHEAIKISLLYVNVMTLFAFVL